MLRGHTDPAFEAVVRFQRMDQREQLDRFGTGAENGEDLGARSHEAAL